MPGEFPVIGHFELGDYFDDQLLHRLPRPLALVTAL
jgi:hypothetical protein